jgi:hypothetical protein
MNRRTVAIAIAPVPPFAWWASTLSLGLLVLLAGLGATAVGVSAFRWKLQPSPRSQDPAPVVAENTSAYAG